MGLYLNDNHPGIHRNEENPKGNNQVFYFHSHEAEKLKEQAQFNESIRKYLLDMRVIYNEQQTKQLRKWKEWDAGYEDVLQKLEIMSGENEQLINKIDAQLIKEDINSKRLDEQDALMNKLTNQLHFLRSSLFERTNFLAEKIEETANSILQFIKRKDAHSERRIIREKEKIGQ